MRLWTWLPAFIQEMGKPYRQTFCGSPFLASAPDPNPDGSLIDLGRHLMEEILKQPQSLLWRLATEGLRQFRGERDDRLSWLLPPLPTHAWVGECISPEILSMQQIEDQFGRQGLTRVPTYPRP